MTDHEKKPPAWTVAKMLTDDLVELRAKVLELSDRLTRAQSREAQALKKAQSEVDSLMHSVNQTRTAMAFRDERLADLEVRLERLELGGAAARAESMHKAELERKSYAAEQTKAPDRECTGCGFDGPRDRAAEEKADALLEELAEVQKRHGLSLSHESLGGFRVVPWDEVAAEYQRRAEVDCG